MSSTHGWIDGVPLELRPRYYPKPPLRFKDIDIYIPLDAIENDYDFTEERRVLVECKMWEEEKERKRLQEEEEEKRRLVEEQRRLEEEKLKAEEDLRRLQEERRLIDEEKLKLDEQLRLEEKLKLEEEEREEIERLEKDASIDLDRSSDPDQSPSAEEERKEDSFSISQPHPHHQPHPILQHSGETETVVSSLPPHSIQPQQQNQTIPNGYSYLMGSDNMQMPMYHQTGQNYYNYYVQPHQPVVAPITPIMTVGQLTLPQQSTAPAVPPLSLLQCQYQSPTVGGPSASGSGGDNSNNSVHSGSVLQQSHFVQQQQQSNQQQQQQTSGPRPPPPSHVPLPTTTATVGCDTTPSVPPVLHYQSANMGGRSAGGGNNATGGGSVLQQSHFVQQQQQQQQQTPTSAQVPLPTTTATLGRDHPEADANSTDNSFTKLHFPFLTSMAASSRSTRDRDNGLGYLSSNFSHSYLSQSSNTPQHHHPSSADDLASQNPFLSSYVQSRSPMQRHQYWPTSHLPPQLSPHQQQQSQNHHHPYSTAHAAGTPVQNGPVHQSALGASNFIATSSGPSTGPPTGSQHALR